MQECFAIATFRKIIQQAPGAITVIDTRTPEEYDLLHIPEAINIPLRVLQLRPGELPKENKIITACSKSG